MVGIRQANLFYSFSYEMNELFTVSGDSIRNADGGVYVSAYSMWVHAPFQ
uniref:Uncharacterized protein n=1 Tax=Anguilla anguilla TaxID=7936 RepID=A0A0E9UDZ2_ANGAN